jgi:hypothetical protein
MLSHHFDLLLVIAFHTFATFRWWKETTHWLLKVSWQKLLKDVWLTHHIVIHYIFVTFYLICVCLALVYFLSLSLAKLSTVLSIYLRGPLSFYLRKLSFKSKLKSYMVSVPFLTVHCIILPSFTHTQPHISIYVFLNLFSVILFS